MLPHSVPQRCSRGMWWKDWGAGSPTAPGPTLGIPVSQLRGLGPAHQSPRWPVFSSRGRRQAHCVSSRVCECAMPKDSPPHTVLRRPESRPHIRLPSCSWSRRCLFCLRRRARGGEPRRMERWLYLPIRSQGQRRPRLCPCFLPTWRCPVHTWRRPCLASGDVRLGHPEHLLLSLVGAPRSKLSAPSSRPRTSDVRSAWDGSKED